MSHLNLIVGLVEKAKTAFQASFLTERMFKTLLMGLIASFLLTACATTTNAPYHGVITKNVGKGNLSDVVIEYVKPIVFRNSTPRSPGSETGSSGDREIPEVMPIRWKTADGRSHSVMVPLKKKLNYANGGLWAIEIRFADDLVEVYEITASGSRREINHFRRIYPE